MTLFQSTTTISGVTIKNMTNATASGKALKAIVKEAKAASVDFVSLVCTHDGDIKGSNASSFAVWANDDEKICNVDNDGITY